MHTFLPKLAVIFFVYAAVFDGSFAQAGELFKVTTRTDIRTTVYWHATDNATATLLVFPGGGGGFGQVEGGLPSSGNFLVRSTPLWIKQGFNIAIFGRPDDSQDLDYADRVADAHMQDVRAVTGWIKQKSSLPIWVVGTSRGTISAAAMLISMQDTQIAGGVLTSSIVNYKKEGALPRQDLAKIRVPMLVYHHSKDACVHCRPHEVSNVLSGLKNAPLKKQMMVSAGFDPTGDVCAGQHYHGFKNMETEAVADISAWIKKPSN